MLAPRVESVRLATFDVNGANVRLENCPLDNQPPAQFEATDAGLAILVEAKENPAPRTIRWKYRIAAAPG
jgi:hypothetical protein